MSKEVDDAKSRLVSMALKLAEGNKKLEAEKQKVMKERKRADAERNKLEEQRKIAEAIRNQAEAEKSYADSMSWQLEETKLRVEKEKCCSDKLSQQLEEARVKIDELQKQIYDLQWSRNRVKASAVSPEKYLTADSGKMKLLEKQLKFEKKQLKQAKQVAKLEKRHNVLLREVLGQLKLDLVQFSNRLDLVDNFLHKAEGIGNLRKKKSFIRSYLKKRKRELDTIESIELFHSEGKKLHLQMGEKLPDFHNMLHRQVDVSLEEENNIVPKLQENSFVKHERCRKKRKKSYEEAVGIQYFLSTDAQKKTKKVDGNSHGDGRVPTEVSQSTIGLTGSARPCAEGICYSVTSDFETNRKFEETAYGDFMKLLDLDNPLDEEYYRKAMEMPMSPTLPEIEFPGAESFDTGKSQDKSFYGGLSDVKVDIAPSCSFDAINAEINSS